MLRSSIAAFGGLLALAVTSSVQAETVTAFGGNWVNSDPRGTGTATFTNEQARTGTGSLKMTTSASGDKSTITYGKVGGLGTLGDLANGTFGYSYFRNSSSTSSAHFAPAFQISFAGGSLKYEPVYNGYPTAGPGVPTNQWVDVALSGSSGLLWQYKSIAPTGTVTVGGAQQNLTLSNWLTTGANYGIPISANTIITNISIQAGSGFNNSFSGYVDDIYVNFGSGNGNFVGNLEAPVVPLPPAALAGGALLMTRLIRRRRETV